MKHENIKIVINVIVHNPLPRALLLSHGAYNDIILQED